jgi:uncharacterized protein YecE (DUF72 family)
MSAHRPRPDLRVGCSGWMYRHWKSDFYPVSLPTTRWLEYYAERFDTVEINNSFYRLPDARTFATWRTRVPTGFLYAVKASRYLTHMKKLKDPEAPVRTFFTQARHLRQALGPVLYQLPPRWPVNLERLNAFLDVLPRRRKHVIEFREQSWYAEPVFESLAERGVGLCLHDMAGTPSVRRVTAAFVYVRFHGTEKYGGRYSDDALARWAGWLNEQRAGGCGIYAYFNNDRGGHAPRDADRLRARLTRAV